jgi:deoxyribonuclease-4
VPAINDDAATSATKRPPRDKNGTASPRATLKKKSAPSEIVVGAHCKGGLKGAASTADEIGAQTVQIFIGSPQTWREPSPASEDIEAFRSSVVKQALGPVFVHGNYLVNLASTSLENMAKSVQNLHAALRMADRAGARGLIFHPGSAGSASYEDGLLRVISSLQHVLSQYSGECKLLLEVCAGQGQTIGDRFIEFKDILSAMGYDKRLGVCWDTCHLFNAGYDVASEEGLKRTVDEFAELVGFEWLYAIHANDSKTPLGARRDRHENIGQGYIGEDGFQRMLHHPALRALPWILEVPGFEDKGPDRKNIEILKRLSL